MIIGRDGPVYECDIGALKVPLPRFPFVALLRWASWLVLLPPCVCRPQRDDVTRSAQFIIHAALDMVDARQWTAPVT
jgi:hypothetical protein